MPVAKLSSRKKQGINDATRGSKLAQLTGFSIVNVDDVLRCVFLPPFHPESWLNSAILAVTNEDVDMGNEEVQKQDTLPLVSLASQRRAGRV